MKPDIKDTLKAIPQLGWSDNSVRGPHPSDILFENDDLKKLDPEMFRVEIQTPFIKTKHIAEMQVRINDQEQTVLLAISNPPMFGSIDHQDTMVLKFQLQEVFEMLKRAMVSQKLSKKEAITKLKLSNVSPKNQPNKSTKPDEFPHWGLGGRVDGPNE